MTLSDICAGMFMGFCLWCLFNAIYLMFTGEIFGKDEQKINIKISGFVGDDKDLSSEIGNIFRRMSDQGKQNNERVPN